MTDITYSEAVERVARAVYATRGFIHSDEEHLFEPFAYDELDEIQKSEPLDAARAALSAIAEILASPTPAMIDAGAQRLVRCGEEPAVWPDSYDALDVAAARQEAERVLLSGIAASPLHEEGK